MAHSVQFSLASASIAAPILLKSSRGRSCSNSTTVFCLEAGRDESSSALYPLHLVAWIHRIERTGSLGHRQQRIHRNVAKTCTAEHKKLDRVQVRQQRTCWKFARGGSDGHAKFDDT
eukprot:1603140-Amphidinium_carterae.1